MKQKEETGMFLEYDCMSLRDYFAAKALQGMIASGKSSDSEWVDMAAGLAYKYADAMLEARKK